MIYLESFYLNNEDRRVYPYNVIYPKMLDRIQFSPITILYGSNGCGKSTILNVIAEKIGLRNKTLGNKNEYFDRYARSCSYEIANEIPQNAMFIRSEDIMEMIASVRKKNAQIDEKVMGWLGGKGKTLEEQTYAKSQIENLYDNTSNYGSSFFDHVKRTLMQKQEQESNGETAISFFKDRLEMDNLYLLDEPENSMAPAFQKELAETLTFLAYRCNCQFIIATHSPFMLSMQGATIYDLDSSPAYEKPWFQLDNMKAYFELFNTYREKFEKEISSDKPNINCGMSGKKDVDNSADEEDNFEWTDLDDEIEDIKEGKKDLLDEFVPIDEFMSEYKRRVEEKYMEGEKPEIVEKDGIVFETIDNKEEYLKKVGAVKLF